MQKVFDEVNSLDHQCYEKYLLSEDILMEHAATTMMNFIVKHFTQHSKVLIVCGSGNNGADGITLSRLLYGMFDVNLYIVKKPKTDIGKLQLKRALKVGVQCIDNNLKLEDTYTVIVDALFGTGFDKQMNQEYIDLIKQLNNNTGYKLACDIPSGINKKGQINQIAFKSDTTITMGALKKSLFLDEAKDFIGEIIVSDLGINREIYENNSDVSILDIDDLHLPIRDDFNTHKGKFGHLSVIVGQKSGAGILCADAAFNFGVGLVSVINHKEYQLPYHIMQNHKLPKNTTAIAIGMGLGNYEKNEILEILNKNIPKVIDADMFYENDIKVVLEKGNTVLTPHPKEFCSLLKIVGIDDVSVDILQKNRFKYVQKFCTRYPKVVLLLKGANTIIGQDKKIYINPQGTNKLSFGGSGDVLSGLIGSLLAQGYSCIDATTNGCLAHSISALNYSKNNYSMTPEDLIEGIKSL